MAGVQRPRFWLRQNDERHGEYLRTIEEIIEPYPSHPFFIRSYPRRLLPLPYRFLTSYRAATQPELHLTKRDPQTSLSRLQPRLRLVLPQPELAHRDRHLHAARLIQQPGRLI
jgi:hypothetical protein